MAPITCPIRNPPPANMPSYDQLALSHNSNAKMIDQLWSSAVVELRWRENGKDRFEQGDGPLILVMPEPDQLPPELKRETRAIVVVVPALETLERRTALSNWASTLKSGRSAVIPDADLAFSRGLVAWGRVVSDTLSSPGLLDLE